VLIVTDDSKLDVVARIEKAAKTLADEVLLLKMKPRSRHGEEPPKAVAMAMLGSDVVVMPTTILSHTGARKKACDAGARVASMPGITTAMLEKGGVHADYGEMRMLTEGVARMGSKAMETMITSSLGGR